MMVVKKNDEFGKKFSSSEIRIKGSISLTILEGLVLDGKLKFTDGY